MSNTTYARTKQLKKAEISTRIYFDDSIVNVWISEIDLWIITSANEIADFLSFSIDSVCVNQLPMAPQLQRISIRFMLILKSNSDEAKVLDLRC